MAEITTEEIREYLRRIEGQVISLEKLRKEFNIIPGSKSFDLIRNIMFRLAEQKVVKPNARGEYKIITQVVPVKVYGRERRPPIRLFFPKDHNTLEEMLVAEDIVIREGDLVLISGRSNFGKTGLCMNFCGENIDSSPVLMGNEYTTIDHEPAPRFMNRLDNMDWIEWVNGNGEDKFTLLPVYADYAEHIIKDRINIIDWINIDSGEFYFISKVMEEMKRAVGKGTIIAALQKAEGASAGRGGQFTKDFADVEILLDQYGEREILMTMGKVKESKKKVTGRSFAFGLSQGVKLTDFREIIKCPVCFGKGWKGTSPCQNCDKLGYVDK